MSKKVKLIAPSAPTEATRVTTSGIGTHLPDEMLAEQVRRVEIFAAVTGSLWGYALFVDTILTPFLLPSFAQQPIHGAALPIEVSGLLVSALTWVYLKYTDHSPHTKLVSGLAFMIATAVGIGVINNWIAPMTAVPGIHLSWTTNLILVFSMIAPMATRWMLPATLIAASMDPLLAWIAHLRGIPTVGAAQTVLMYLPNFTAAFVSIIPGKIMRHVGRRLREAQELGSYQLIELLGHGGMGEVWRAKHRLLARNAAIKLVRPEVLGASNDTEARVMLRRFEREAQATAALSSPHTIRIFDFGMTDEGVFYYVMELLAGRDLESLVKEFGPVPASRTLMLLRQACHSLADAHARGMVHRDIKPANLYVCRMGLEYDFVKVLDFGLVKVNGTLQPETIVTMQNTTTGTPAYMAPEIVLGEQNVDPRADVYALGCVAYYLLTGQLVFEAETSIKMMLQHMQAQPVAPSERTELPIPRELDEVILQCLQKDPNHRPQTAQELLRLLNQISIRDPWTEQDAKLWWERHLPEMTGPLVPGSPDPDAMTVVSAVGVVRQ